MKKTKNQFIQLSTTYQGPVKVIQINKLICYPRDEFYIVRI